MSDYTELAHGTGAYGIRWAVGLDHGALKVEAPGVILDGAERERFAEAVARAAMPSQVPSRVKHGPWCGCTPCKNEPSYEARRG